MGYFSVLRGLISILVVSSRESVLSSRLMVDSSLPVELCNASSYNEWYDSPYSGPLTEDLTDFWLFSDAALSNGQAMEVVSSSCLLMLSTARLDLAGRNGPLPDKHVFDIMCAQECTSSDALREEAMTTSGCTCLELSTQSSDPAYHLVGDWCRANSGRCVRNEITLPFLHDVGS